MNNMCRFIFADLLSCRKLQEIAFKNSHRISGFQKLINESSQPLTTLLALGTLCPSSSSISRLSVREMSDILGG